MNALEKLKKGLTLPVISAPMFLVSDVDLVVECCKNGIIGTFPALNRRTTEEFEAMVVEIKTRLEAWEKETGKEAAPYGINHIVHMTNPRVQPDIAVCVKHQVPLIITSLGAVTDVVDAVHSYGGVVLHDVIKRRHAEKAIEAGVDGLILVCAGAGGHAGTLNPMPFIKEVRGMFDGVIALSGAMSDGVDIASALQMGADIAYMGTRFINTVESNAQNEYRQMINDSKTDDIVYTQAVSGVDANFMKLSLVANDIPKEVWDQKGKVDFKGDLGSEAKAWKTIWSAGQGVTSIDDVPTVAELVQRMKTEFKAAIQKQQTHLDEYK